MLNTKLFWLLQQIYWSLHVTQQNAILNNFLHMDNATRYIVCKSKIDNPGKG